MGRALIDEENSFGRNIVACLAAGLILPLFIVVKLVMKPFERPRQLSPEEVAALLRSFIDDTATGGEIDYFVCCDIADPVWMR